MDWILREKQEILFPPSGSGLVGGRLSLLIFARGADLDPRCSKSYEPSWILAGIRWEQGKGVEHTHGRLPSD
jgi:hypothetical protein